MAPRIVERFLAPGLQAPQEGAIVASFLQLTPPLVPLPSLPGWPPHSPPVQQQRPQLNYYFPSFLAVVVALAKVLLYYFPAKQQQLAIQLQLITPLAVVSALDL